MPIAAICRTWTGLGIPSTEPGTASPSPSGRNAATRRECIRGTLFTCRPALPSPSGGAALFHGPSSTWRWGLRECDHSRKGGPSPVSNLPRNYAWR